MSSSAGSQLPALAASERLGRGIFQGSEARKAAKGHVPHKVFRERTEKASLSVDRLDHADAETMARGDDAAAIEAAVKALADGTEAFAAARMNRGIHDALAGRRVDEV